MSKLVAAVLPESVKTHATLHVNPDKGLALNRTVTALRAAGRLPADSEPSTLREALLPDSDPAMFAAFWDEHAATIMDLVRARYQAFTADANAPTPTMAVAPTPTRVDRESLAAEIRSIYATALEYPEEVFEDDTLLEAELGVDSVKQVELVLQVSTRYGLGDADDSIQLSEYTTIGKVVDFVHGALAGVAEPLAAPSR